MGQTTSAVQQGTSPSDPLSPDEGAPRIRLTDAETAAILALVDDVLDEDPDTALELRLERLAVRAHEMPERLRSALTGFRVSGRPYGGVVISGLPIDESAAGPTPTKYTDDPQGREVDKAACLLLMIGSLLGNPFSYLTQQRGRMVLDVFPVSGHEESQLGSSSTALLEWHNEDAFHPYRADWIMLIGIRNHDGVPTMFAPLQDLDLTPRTRELLFQDRFIIKPDESHTAEFNADTTGFDEDVEAVSDAFDRVREMNTNPVRVPILGGDRRAPFVRLDPAFMERDLDDPAAEGALEEVISKFDASMRDVVLAPGEMLIIDNFRAVHGRRPFQARYDGTDRWLRRINVTADLRKSEDRRFGPHGRAVI
ncbi:guanitoxin biosynthesis L-enduracididine beta-hydroxylase GntD [Streptomyces sp. NPDC046862]|uniref:guanitoxin biosynthesis L-enduracididine beta-hydroxylase GntD n=1 Tax=Streptomyces sp. NPDC046862 TaxID=3154603 RepID=UPI0034537D8C